MPDAPAQTGLYLSVTTPLGPDTFYLTSFSGAERVSGLFHYRLDLLSGGVDVDPAALLGQKATVTIQYANGQQRHLNGVIIRFLQNGDGTTYVAELRPWLWQLGLTLNSQVFQNLSVPDILEKVFGAFGMTDFRRSLTGTYNPREYCVQYQESALGFVSRLMEEEGIFYFFEHTADKHTLVLADTGGVHQPCPGLDPLAWDDGSRSWPVDDVVRDLEFGQHLTPGTATVNDYNFETPDVSLKTQAQAGGTTDKWDRYEYPAGYLQTADGESKASLRLAAAAFPSEAMSGVTNCRGLAAGSKFTLKSYPRTAANREYVLREVTLTADQSGFQTSFVAFPSSATFRPLCVTPKPIIASAQTALVVGKQGEEIWTDKYGRIMVQFYWDRLGKKDEKSSCWIRVAQTWSGKGWGSVFLPRIGQEVVVSFLEGNPDRPLITGTVYNASQVLPYTFPDNQTVSTVKSQSSKDGQGGSNEIRFQDLTGKEELLFRAHKDQCSWIGNIQVESVKKSRHVFIQENPPAVDQLKDNVTDKATLDANAKDELVVEGNRSITIKKDDSEETHTNEGKFTQKVAKTFLLKVAGDTLTIEATNDLIIKGKTVTIESTGGDLTLKSAANLAASAAQDLTQKATGEISNQATRDFSAKGLNVTVEAQVNLTNKANVNLSNEAQVQNKVSGSAMVQIQGGIVQIN
ncbi:MAG: type VI secretion system tip protein VgrG [Verrucomicrobiales bacterium]|nr:type VI secretion system tip protein VgrG [Verrucomicrobiales bacterium]